MLKEYLEIGQIVNTHGIHGEVKVQPWCDSPDYLNHFTTFYIDDKPVQATEMRTHKGHVLLCLEGIFDINAAEMFKGKILSVLRADAPLSEGRYFISELIGLPVLDADTGESLGLLDDVFSSPANDVYVVRGKKEYMIPAVPEFIREIDLNGGLIRVHVLEGMASDEN